MACLHHPGFLAQAGGKLAVLHVSDCIIACLQVIFRAPWRFMFLPFGLCHCPALGEGAKNFPCKNSRHWAFFGKIFLFFCGCKNFPNFTRRVNCFFYYFPAPARVFIPRFFPSLYYFISEILYIARAPSFARRGVFLLLGLLRPKIKSFASFIARPFARAGFPPNLFTLLGPAFAIAAAWFIAKPDFAPAFALALLAVLVDLFDGEVARLQKKESLFGNYFETMADKLVEIILFISAAFLFPIASIFALAFSMLNSYAKPRVALVIITDNRDWPALGEHSERMLIFLTGLAGSALSFSFVGFAFFEFCLWLIALIAGLGFVQRIFYAKKLIIEAEKNGTMLPYLKKK